MSSGVRRVVTGHDAGGKAIVLMDGVAANVRVRQASNLTSTLLWVTDETPADVSSHTDRADRQIGVAPPAGGSILRIVDFPPVTPDVASFDNEAVTREMGIAHDAGSARHPFMHRTKSIDYAIVLSGEIDMLLDESEIHLKAGDVLVQQGTNHAWVNNGAVTCRIAFVLIDADLPTQLCSSKSSEE